MMKFPLKRTLLQILSIYRTDMSQDSKNEKQKVLLALSGGVDSVASAILLKRVYEVETVTFLMTGNIAQQEEQTAKASEVAQMLGISHHVLDLTQLFHEQVLQPFLDAWRSGKTPNPCVVCNPHVKFKALMTLAFKLDCDFIATGHYARVGKGNSFSGIEMNYSPPRRDVNEYAVNVPAGAHSASEYSDAVDLVKVNKMQRSESPVFLYRAADPRRDQSYFMYRLPPEVLRRVIFPLGGLSKDEARAIVAEEGLSAATEADSQDLCFLGGKSLRDYLRDHVALNEPGPFLDLQGRAIGEHRGIWQFTIGQRRRLGETFGRRMTVVALDPERRAVTLGDESDAVMDAVILEDCYFPYDMPQKFDATVKLRSQGIPLHVHVEKVSNKEIMARFDGPVRLSSPGQSAVFYEDDRLLGGGIVTRLLRL